MTDLAAEGDRYREPHEHFVVCTDCGCVISTLERRTHDRWHSILASHAWALAVLQTAHVAAHIHDRYEVPERINSKKFDNWSADALAEVMTGLPEGEPDV